MWYARPIPAAAGMPARCSPQGSPWTLICLWLVIATGTFGWTEERDPWEGLRPPVDAPERPTLLVLKTGQVVVGVMEPQVGGYMVLVPNGRQLFTYDQVWTAATSLTDAYSRIRRNQRNPTANERIELARWCFQQGLTEEARIELAAALQLEPERPEARQLLQRLEAALQRQRPPPSSVRATGDRVSAAAKGGEWSPAGLSGERTGEFMRVVQPIVLNRCGNAACHGAASANAFRLEPASGGRASRAVSEANLAAVLGQITPQEPESSPVLARPRSGAGAHQGLLRERRMEDNLSVLAEWVRAVSGEARSFPATRGAGPPGNVPPEGLTRFGTTPGEQHPLVSAVTPIPTVGDLDGAGAGVLSTGGAIRPVEEGTLPAESSEGSAVPTRLSGVDESLLRRILDEERPDPFDPNEFNRLVHGREARPQPRRP